MSEAREWLFEPSINRAVLVCASDERITSDAGLVLLREADHPKNLTGKNHLVSWSRSPGNVAQD